MRSSEHNKIDPSRYLLVPDAETTMSDSKWIGMRPCAMMAALDTVKSKYDWSSIDLCSSSRALFGGWVFHSKFSEPRYIYIYIYVQDQLKQTLTQSL